VCYQCNEHLRIVKRGFVLKKVFISIGLIFLSNCIVLDKLNLSLPESVSGREAKTIIVTAAISGAAISSAVEGQVTVDAALSLVANKLAGVKDDAYYDKIDVDQCAAEAQLINVVTVRVGGFQCNLQEHKKFTNWPIRIFL